MLSEHFASSSRSLASHFDMDKTSDKSTAEIDNTLDKHAADVKRLLRQQAALATFGSFAFRETELLKILNEAARICAERSQCPVLQDRALPLERE